MLLRVALSSPRMGRRMSGRVWVLLDVKWSNGALKRQVDEIIEVHDDNVQFIFAPLFQCFLKSIIANHPRQQF